LAYAIGAATGIALLVLAFYVWQRDTGPALVPVVEGRSRSLPRPRFPSMPDAQVHYPIDARMAAAPSGKEFDLQKALEDLFGLKTVQSMFRLDDFPRRLAATIDNLGRSHASAALWPVNPVGGRFIVEEHDGATFVGADNGLRYTPYVLLLETVDLRQAVGRLHANLSVSSAGLRRARLPGELPERPSCPGDRSAAGDARDRRTHRSASASHRGTGAAGASWVLYEFADPNLQSLTSGQKVLLRMGSINERRIKTRLAEIRRLVTAAPKKR
jgi:hypothetical protein